MTSGRSERGHGKCSTMKRESLKRRADRIQNTFLLILLSIEVVCHGKSEREHALTEVLTEILTRRGTGTWVSIFIIDCSISWSLMQCLSLFSREEDGVSWWTHLFVHLFRVSFLVSLDYSLLQLSCLQRPSCLEDGGRLKMIKNLTNKEDKKDQQHIRIYWQEQREQENWQWQWEWKRTSLSSWMFLSWKEFSLQREKNIRCNAYTIWSGSPFSPETVLAKAFRE